MVVNPLDGAVQLHQTEAPPKLLAMRGSPNSRPAPTLLPVAVTVGPLKTMALPKLSFTGACAWTVKVASSVREITLNLQIRIFIFDAYYSAILVHAQNP